MSDRYAPCPCVVVGIDGSRSAVQAAVWAVDEAADRDIPLRLLYAIDSASNDPDDTAADVATAQKAVHHGFTTIQSVGKPIKMESEIVHSHPIAALLEASRSAAMICVGSIGLEGGVQGRIGSTASALAAAARCPVAVVPPAPGSAPPGVGLVLAVVDESPDNSAVLERSVAEARLRGAPLRVFTVHHPPHSGVDHADAVGDRSQRVEAELEHRLAHWRRNHPDLDIERVLDHGGLLNHLEQLQRNATPIQLVVVGPLQPGPVDVLLGGSGRTALEAAGCTLMICDRQWWS